MTDWRQSLLRARSADLVKLVNRPHAVLLTLVQFGLFSPNDLNAPASLVSVIDSLAASASTDGFKQFCVSLLVTGHIRAFSLLAHTLDSTLDDFKLPYVLRNFLDPRQLRTLSDARKNTESQIPVGSKKRGDSLLRLKCLFGHVRLKPVLDYLLFYEVLSSEQVQFVQNSPPENQASVFLRLINEASSLALERLAHGLILTEQWVSFATLHGEDELELDYEILETISQQHLDLLSKNVQIQNQENYPNVAAVGDESVGKVEFGLDDEEFDEEPLPPPDDISFEVVTDGPSAESLYIGKENNIYRNFSTPKGFALILNIKKFANNMYGERQGTDVDAAKMEALLKKLGYNVDVVKNPTSTEMLYHATRIATHPDQRLMDSCVVVVLTHGLNDVLIGSDVKEVNVHTFLRIFNAQNAPLLAGKPKIFFLQACRGDSRDDGIVRDTPDVGFLPSLLACMRPNIDRERIYNNNSTANVASMLAASEPRLAQAGFPEAVSARRRELESKQRSRQKPPAVKEPTETDMLIAFATTPNYVSWRNSTHGTWFIQSICEIFSKFAATEDIYSLLTRVNRKVAHEYESSNDRKKQTPEFTTRLRKLFYFFPGISHEPRSTTV